MDHPPFVAQPCRTYIYDIFKRACCKFQALKPLYNMYFFIIFYFGHHLSSVFLSALTSHACLYFIIPDHAGAWQAACVWAACVDV